MTHKNEETIINNEVVPRGLLNCKNWNTKSSKKKKKKHSTKFEIQKILINSCIGRET